MLKKAQNYFFQEIDIKTWILLFAGTIIWYLTTVKSGLVYDFGMGFWGAHGHDALWHLALIKSLARGSFEMPVFAGAHLQNYHIGYDLFVAILHKLTFIPVRYLYFQILPPIMALLTGLFTYKFVVNWSKSKSAGFWSVFFVYFGGSWGWLFHIVRYGYLGGDSMFWAQSAATTLVNPPFAMSLVIMLAGLLVLQGKKLGTGKILIAGLLFGILFQIKVYAGLLVLTGLLGAGVYEFFFKRSLVYLKILGVSLLVSLLMYLAVPTTGRLVEYAPFWFLEGLMTYGDRLNWDWYSKTMFSAKETGNMVNYLLLYSAAFVIFVIGNLGTRIVKLPLFVKWTLNYKKLAIVEVFILTVVAAGIVVPMLFVQRGTAWNTIQFIYYSLFFSGILAGVAMPSITKSLKSVNVRLSQVFIVLVVVLTLPTTLTTLRHYFTNNPPTRLPKDEIAALEFLQYQPYGLVLSTQPFGMKYLGREEEAPMPLFLYDSTAYVAAFTDKPVYLEDEVNLTIMNYPWQERRTKLDKFLKDSNSEAGYQFLRDENIDYIYLVKRSGVGLDENALNIDNIFDNEEVIVYKVH